MRNAYVSALHELAVRDPRVMALISDNGAIVYDRYRADFPGRFLNCGISEANMVSVAAGLAACGKVPFAYTISSFLVYRAYEQIRVDVCLQRLNVKLVGIGVGFVYSALGPTHHGTEDIAVMRCLPHLTIFSPADPLETRKVTAAAAAIDGPVYIRIATGGSPPVYDGEYDFVVGRAVELRPGRDLTLISTGTSVHEALLAARALAGEGVSARCLNVHTIKPIDREAIVRAARETRRILVLEDQNVDGGLAGAVAEVLLEEGAGDVAFRRLGLRDRFAEGYGTADDLREMNGVSRAHAVAAARELLGR